MKFVLEKEGQFLRRSFVTAVYTRRNKKQNKWIFGLQYECFMKLLHETVILFSINKCYSGRVII